MATASQVRRLRFAFELRQALDDSGQSVRGLSRRLNPESPETARSNLSRWLRGAHVPSRASRRAVAAALGLPADHFGDDDPEEDLDVAELLTNAIRRMVRDEIRAAA